MYPTPIHNTVFDSDKLRSFKIFFGLGDQGPYSLACSPTKLFPRVKNNIVFFYLNYVVVTFVVFVLCLLAFLMSPMSLVILLCLAAVWFVVLKGTGSEGFKVLGVTITRKEASFVLMIISGIVAFFAFQNVFWMTLGSSATLSLGHAVFRDAESHQLVVSDSEGLQTGTEFQQL